MELLVFLSAAIPTHLFRFACNVSCRSFQIHRIDILVRYWRNPNFLPMQCLHKCRIFGLPNISVNSSVSHDSNIHKIISIVVSKTKRSIFIFVSSSIVFMEVISASLVICSVLILPSESTNPIANNSKKYFLINFVLLSKWHFLFKFFWYIKWNFSLLSWLKSIRFFFFCFGFCKFHIIHNNFGIIGCISSLFIFDLRDY